ncbi:tetratricopeptide repeat protein, partial [Streptomyces sp. NPDC005318]|uniref:tetratricopeptide repeat protein n=1 Tax=Streptomyces sp. NPDC005318 TaxID=3157031 RepID=UPI0033A1443F
VGCIEEGDDASDCPVNGHVADIFRATTTYALGRDHAALGRWCEAAGHYRNAVVQSRRIGLTRRESQSLVYLGKALIELGEFEEARSCVCQALALDDDAADPEALKTAQKLLDSLPCE